MAKASSPPSVVAVVDEAGNQVLIGVTEGKKFLPVASAALDAARARDLDAPGKAGAKDDGNGGEA